MNGPLTMYKLKPIVHFTKPVELTNSMYKMKNIININNSISVSEEDDSQHFPDIMEQVNNQLLKDSPSAVESLKKRQDSILKQLTHLKEQMLALREELSKECSSTKNDIKKTAEITSHQSYVKQPAWNGVIEEVVIHASVDYPPYSLLALHQLWPDLRVQVSCHVHSSVLSIPPHLAVFSSLQQTLQPSLKIRLVWKAMGPDTELIVSPLSHTPIRGEVNLLRYLYRTVCARTDAASDVQLDSLLDTCHRLRHAHTVRDKQALVRALNARLGKATWFGGENMSVGDAAAWSAVQSLAGVDLTQNMSRWKLRCSVAAGIETA